MRNLPLFAILLSMALTIEQAAACRALQFQTTVLLEELPTAASQEPIVAMIEILEVVPPKESVRAKARIIQPIKGVKQEQIIFISAPCHSCGTCFSQKLVGHRAYIAGRFEKDENGSIFVGEWGVIDGKPRHVRKDQAN
jgi:hypothetical protein